MTNNSAIAFKTDRIEKEFYSDEWHTQTRGLARELARVTALWFRKKLVITCIIRTMDEQLAVYQNQLDKELTTLEKIRISPHLVKRTSEGQMLFPCYAFDQSIIGYSPTEIDRLVLWGNHYWKRCDGKETCFMHDIGSGGHIHWQFKT